MRERGLATVLRVVRSAFSVLGLCLGQAALAEGGTTPPAAAAPTGSFERAGLAVFVRAHEARRNGIGLAPTASGLLASASVAAPAGFQGTGPDAAANLDVPHATGSAAERRWVGPSELPARPGMLGTDAPRPAGPLGRTGLLGTRAAPDLELPVTRRTTIGVFGDAHRIEPTDIRNATTRATRDLGAGVTLQYRFGE